MSIFRLLNLVQLQLRSASESIRRTEKDLPQFLSNLTRPITHKVILAGGGGGVKFVPVIATLPILGLKFIKLFCAFLSAILWFSCAKSCG